jgi:hypothetical protein
MTLTLLSIYTITHSHYLGHCLDALMILLVVSICGIPSCICQDLSLTFVIYVVLLDYSKQCLRIVSNSLFAPVYRRSSFYLKYLEFLLGF